MLVVIAVRRLVVPAGYCTYPKSCHIASFQNLERGILIPFFSDPDLKDFTDDGRTKFVSAMKFFRTRSDSLDHAPLFHNLVNFTNSIPRNRKPQFSTHKLSEHLSSCSLLKGTRHDETSNPQYNAQ